MTTERLLVLFVRTSGGWRCDSIGHTVQPSYGHARRIDVPTSIGQADLTCAGGKWRATSIAPDGRVAKTSRHSSRERCLSELWDLLDQRVTA